MQRESKRRQKLVVNGIVFLSDGDVAGLADPATCFSQQLFQAPGGDHGAKNVHQRDVSGLNAVKHDDVAHEVGVGLLPERFFPFAPDGGDDRSNIESLGIGIEVVVQRVIANVRIQTDVDVVPFTAASLQDSSDL